MKPLTRGLCIVIFVPEMTRSPPRSGMRNSSRIGLNQVHSMKIASSTITPAGTAMRAKRTQRL